MDYNSKQTFRGIVLVILDYVIIFFRRELNFSKKVLNKKEGEMPKHYEKVLLM